MATKLEGQKKPTIRLPATSYEWRQLMHQALSRAETARDPRAGGLRKALDSGQFEKHLRLMGIVCPADIEREFPTR
jgi:hypothetical protein